MRKPLRWERASWFYRAGNCWRADSHTQVQSRAHHAEDSSTVSHEHGRRRHRTRACGSMPKQATGSAGHHMALPGAESQAERRPLTGLITDEGVGGCSARRAG